MLCSDPRVAPRRPFTLTASLCLLYLGTSHAIEVRHTEGARYSADFTRAYEPCTVPNDMTSNGVPACSPAVTSACSYTSGGLDLRKREDTNEINLDAKVSNVSGPASCPVGPYYVRLGLRITVDDPACATGACTLLDFPVSIPMTKITNDFRLTNFTLESAFPGLPLDKVQAMNYNPDIKRLVLVTYLAGGDVAGGEAVCKAFLGVALFDPNASISVVATDYSQLATCSKD